MAVKGADAKSSNKRPDVVIYISYKEYLQKIANLARDVNRPGGAAAYPPALLSAAQRALYNNLGQDEALALAVDAAIQGHRQADWQTNAMKTKRVRVAILAVLLKAVVQPPVADAAMQTTALGDYPAEVLADRIVELAKHQNDY